MGSCDTRPSTALSAAQRRLIIITAPASIMKVRARARVRARMRVRVRVGILCWCRERQGSPPGCIRAPAADGIR